MMVDISSVKRSFGFRNAYNVHNDVFDFGWKT